MANEKMLMGQLVLDIVAFTNMGNREFADQFKSFVDAKMVLTMPNGKEKEFSIGEILEVQFEAFDEDGIEIVEELTY
jgi:hypothetical protein